jgi:hypothetical protein
MLTTFCTGYAMGMATVGVAIILVDNYLNPKTDKPNLDIVPKLEAHINRRLDAKLERKEKPKAVRETKPVKAMVQPVMETVEEEFTLEEILLEFK